MYYFIVHEIRYNHRRNERNIVDVFPLREQAYARVAECNQAVKDGEASGIFFVYGGKKRLELFFPDKTEMKRQLKKVGVKP